MSEVTRLLDAVELGEPQAAEELLPLVYEELRRLATAKMASQPPGQTIQATALVHEAYLRLVGSPDPSWSNSRHFFYAAAEAMRHILVDRARRKLREKRGAKPARIDVDPADLAQPDQEAVVLDLNDALLRLRESAPDLAEIVNLRFFVGLSEKEIAGILNSSERSVQRRWAYARARLVDLMGQSRAA